MNYPLAVTQRINARSLLFVLTEFMYISGGLAVFVIVERSALCSTKDAFPQVETASILEKSGV